MAKLRAAVIGCGSSSLHRGRSQAFAYAHGWAYTAAPDIELVAAVSRTVRKTQDFCSEFPGTRGYQDFREMLGTERPDLVSICVRPEDRAGMVGAAVEAGVRGIWLEKPFARSLGEARTLMEITRQAGVRLFINTQRRYGLPFNWLREAVAGCIGDLQSLEVVQPGPNLLGTGTHLLDAALYALGDRQAEQVLAAVDLAWSEEGHPFERQAVATVHLSDGARLTFEAGHFSVRRACPAFRANGSEGFAELYFELPSSAQSVFRARYQGEAETVNPPTSEDFHHSEDPGLYVKRAAVDIAQALLTGVPTRLDATESYRTLEIIMGIFESARLGRALLFPIVQTESPLDLWQRGTSPT